MKSSKLKRQKISVHNHKATAATPEAQSPLSGNASAYHAPVDSVHYGTVHNSNHYHNYTFNLGGVSSETLSTLLSNLPSGNTAALARTATSSNLKRKPDDETETPRSPSEVQTEEDDGSGPKPPGKSVNSSRPFSRKSKLAIGVKKSALGPKQKVTNTTKTVHGASKRQVDAAAATDDPEDSDYDDDNATSLNSSPLRNANPSRSRLFSKKPRPTMGIKQSALSSKQTAHNTTDKSHSVTGVDDDRSGRQLFPLRTNKAKSNLETSSHSDLSSEFGTKAILDGTSQVLSHNLLPGMKPEDYRWPPDDQTKSLDDRVSTLYTALKEYHRKFPHGILLSATPPVYLDWKVIKELSPTKSFSNTMIRNLIMWYPFPRDVIPIIRGYENETLNKLTDKVNAVWFFEVRAHHWFLIHMKLRRTSRRTSSGDIRIYDPLNKMDEEAMENQCSDATKIVTTTAHTLQAYDWEFAQWKFKQMKHRIPHTAASCGPRVVQDALILMTRPEAMGKDRSPDVQLRIGHYTRLRALAMNYERQHSRNIDLR
ncbi:hypothetical protein LTR84_001862 [Exophiala bonariae]|uniref:Ubiquitin-like protease family profile domain-containing protein n=1 Tax=Exophiala bonariae TaxID=1690606 RepID=A0AAV9NCP7_9EURO|nr:hypothetical protein LTR84_001862 [Exophiala bonariae]